MTVEVGERGRAGRVADGLRRTGPDILIVAALLGLFFCVHRYFEEVEFGGDAVEKWQFVRQWSYDNDFAHATWTHHMARMGVNCFTWLVQALFGRDWRAYYVGPFFMAALQVPFMFLLAKRLGGRLAGLVAVLSITYLAMVHRSASQLLPDGYAGTYAIVACYLYVRFLEAGQRARLPWLIGLSVVSFLGYLAKETFVFFYPGLVLAVWLARRSWRDVAVFLGILLAGLLLETAAYVIFTDYSSRYAVVRGTHLAGADEAGESTLKFADLFVRFDELHNSTKYLMFFAFGAALWLAVLRKDEQPKSRAVVLIGLSHVVCVTFAIRGIRPLEIFQGFDPRYMEPATPFIGVYAGSFIGVIAKELWGQHASGNERVARYGPAGAAPVQALWCVAVISVFAYLTWSGQRKEPPFDAFARGRELSGLMNRTYDRNLPILERSNRAKVLTALYDVYLDDARLARDGKLPTLEEAALKQRGITYLVKDPSKYEKGALSRMMKAGCAIEVGRGPARNRGTRDRRSTIGIEGPGVDPPASCEALLASE